MGQISIDELLEMLGGTFSPRAKNSDKGELVIVGSGIAPLRQMSLETIQYLRAADIVYHAAQTAAEEAFIAMNAKESFDLRCLYGPTKDRMKTYVQMAELMMRDVRAGKLVVGLLYGHPGVFATPGHRAIAIAREEGYPAKMLPGISAEDNLFADLGIEPGMPGCAHFEASALVYHRLEMDTKLHNLIWQPGAVGKKTMEMNGDKLTDLLDYLEERYGAEYPIYIYQAGILPGEQSVIEHHTIQELRSPEVSMAVTPGCTLYVPPKEIMATRGGNMQEWDPVVLNFPRQATDTEYKILLPATSAYRFSHPEIPLAPLYGDGESKVIAALDDYLDFVAKEAAEAKKEDECIPGQYNPMVSSPQMQRAAIRLALSHHTLLSDPDQRAELVGELLTSLTPEEKEAVLSAQPYATERAMRARQQSGAPEPTVLTFFIVFAIIASLAGHHDMMNVPDETLIGLS